MNNFIAISLLLTIQPFQALASSCKQKVSSVGNLQIETLETSKGCDMLLSPIDENPSYRAYSFSERGLIQIFNHYDFPGATEAKGNASRSFFVFPRKQIPTFSVSSSTGNVRAITSSGEAIDLFPGAQENASAPHLENDSSSMLQVTEVPEVNPNNSGGVTLTLSAGAQLLILDTGFAVGGVAFTQPNGISIFTDSFGNRCALTNSELFSFSDYDADLKFQTDAALYDYLKGACPRLRTP